MTTKIIDTVVARGCATIRDENHEHQRDDDDDDDESDGHSDTRLVGRPHA